MSNPNNIVQSFTLDKKDSSLWVITREINEYNQEGEYFVAVFKDKPTKEELIKLLPNEPEKYVDHLLTGGDRLDKEDEWYNLYEIKYGVNYDL